MQNSKTRMLVFTALLSALCCVATMTIAIPTPLGGYVHAGDCVVLLSAFMLNPIAAAFAAGIGSAFADIFAGYVVFAPATFVIKALVAYIASMLFRHMKFKTSLTKTMLSGLVAAVPVIVLGYFIYQATILGFGLAAAVDVPANAVQAVFGAISASVLYEALSKSAEFRKIFS